MAIGKLLRDFNKYITLNINYQNVNYFNDIWNIIKDNLQKTWKQQFKSEIQLINHTINKTKSELNNF